MLLSVWGEISVDEAGGSQWYVPWYELGIQEISLIAKLAFLLNRNINPSNNAGGDGWDVGWEISPYESPNLGPWESL